jgi:hypothetical protein
VEMLWGGGRAIEHLAVIAQPPRRRSRALARHDAVGTASAGVSLTGGGQLFLERANAILRELNTIETEVSGRTVSAAGVVTVGASPTVSRVLLAPLAAAFRGPVESDAQAP